MSSGFCKNCKEWVQDPGDNRYGRCRLAKSINQHTENACPPHPILLTNGYLITNEGFACNEWSER
jgi:hypothetical protein